MLCNTSTSKVYVQSSMEIDDDSSHLHSLSTMYAIIASLMPAGFFSLHFRTFFSFYFERCCVVFAFDHYKNEQIKWPIIKST